MLSHIKAPLREEKREVASYPEPNLSIFLAKDKQIYQIPAKHRLVLAWGPGNAIRAAFGIQAQFSP